MPSDNWPVTVDDVLARIQAGRRPLKELVAGLEDSTLEHVGQSGWSIRDHLAHIAAWEASALALLAGESRAAALGVSEELFGGGDVDAINAAIVAAARRRPLEEVIGRFHQVHADLVAALGRLEDADLTRPYASFQPTATGDKALLPALAWIVGNTFEHYAEHTHQIQALVEEV